ncbi:hypothetical protein C8J56DRAFT_1056285 [Mycena floridula]|nr:hypothetical protein C8J56DRAFT_1056285 [Mycena floridula]
MTSSSPLSFSLKLALSLAKGILFIIMKELTGITSSGFLNQNSMSYPHIATLQSDIRCGSNTAPAAGQVSVTPLGSPAIVRPRTPIDFDSQLSNFSLDELSDMRHIPALASPRHTQVTHRQPVAQVPRTPENPKIVGRQTLCANITPNRMLDPELLGFLDTRASRQTSTVGLTAPLISDRTPKRTQPRESVPPPSIPHSTSGEIPSFSTNQMEMLMGLHPVQRQLFLNNLAQMLQQQAPLTGLSSSQPLQPEAAILSNMERPPSRSPQTSSLASASASAQIPLLPSPIVPEAISIPSASTDASAFSQIHHSHSSEPAQPAKVKPVLSLASTSAVCISEILQSNKSVTAGDPKLILDTTT